MAEDHKSNHDRPKYSCEQEAEEGVEEGTPVPVAKPNPASGYNGRNADVEDRSKENHPAVNEANDKIRQKILHGDPVTISQCTFQAHIAR